MVPKKEVFARISPELYVRIQDLLEFYGAPSISRLIEGMLEDYIQEMDKEKTLAS